MKILFLTLRVFSANGGIEKVSRLAGKVMHEYSTDSQGDFTMFSMCDERGTKTEPYLPSSVFTGFGVGRSWFSIKSLREAIKSRVVVLSHINLVFTGYLIKLLSPKTKVVLIAHDIEAAKALAIRKKRMLKRIDLVIALSDFTKEKMKNLFELPAEKFRVITNCLDPFLPAPADESRRNECREIYGIDENDFLLMTLSHLSSGEKNKGYDKVLIAVKKLHTSFPHLKYLFVGKYDTEEKARLDSVIHDLGIEDDVIFTGFVPDAVLADFYNMADVYVMPAEKEGFGFPFINALYYNKPVLAGWSDGITDNLYGNGLGTMIDLRSQEDITLTIQKIITDVKAFMPDRELLMEKFSYSVFKNNWVKVMDELKVYSL